MAIVVAAPAVSAQAASVPELLTSSPEQGARLTAPPNGIQLEFSAWPIPGSSISVTGPDGQDVGLGPTLVLGTNAIQYLQGDLPNGTYVVRYLATFGLIQHTYAAGTVVFTVRPAPSRTSTAAPAPSRTGGTSRHAKPSATRAPRSPTPSASRTGASGSGPRARGADLVALGAPTGSGGTAGGGGLPLPPTLLLAVLALATTGFAADRWWETHRDRAQLRRAATGTAAPGASRGGGSSPPP